MSLTFFFSWPSTLVLWLSILSFIAANTWQSIFDRIRCPLEQAVLTLLVLILLLLQEN